MHKNCIQKRNCLHWKKKRCQSKPMRFRGILLHTLGYCREIRNLYKSFVISQVSYETLPGFAAERVSYRTSQRYRGQEVSYETVFFLIPSTKETTVYQTKIRRIIIVSIITSISFSLQSCLNISLLF